MNTESGYAWIVTALILLAVLLTVLGGALLSRYSSNKASFDEVADVVENEVDVLLEEFRRREAHGECAHSGVVGAHLRIQEKAWHVERQYIWEGTGHHVAFYRVSAGFVEQSGEQIKGAYVRLMVEVARGSLRHDDATTVTVKWGGCALVSDWVDALVSNLGGYADVEEGQL